MNSVEQSHSTVISGVCLPDVYCRKDREEKPEAKNSRGSHLSTHMAVHNHLQLCFRELSTLGMHRGRVPTDMHKTPEHIS